MATHDTPLPPPSDTTHDLVVIGTGSGNSVLSSAMRDWRIAIVEEWAMGGTCLNRGCIPSKMFVLSADRAHQAANGERFDISTSFDGADWPAMRDRVFGRIDPIEDSGRDYRVEQDNVDLYEAHGRFVAPWTLQVGDEQVTAPRFVLAAGARPDIPEWDGIEDLLADGRAHTSDTIMRIDDLPEHLVIVGGGFVGVEMAHVFAGLGSRVTMLVRGDTLLRDEDPDVIAAVTAAYRERVDLHLGVRIVDATGRDADRVAVELADREAVVGDMLLLATGRVPNSDTLGVEATGVEVDAEGYVVVDDHQRTSVAGIWALGDLSSPLQLKHKANADARVVSHNLVHPDDPVALELGPVPHAVFGSPQVASVGETEPQVRARGVDPLVAVHDYGSAAYGWALEDESSFVKLLADPDTRLLLGAHVVGPQASTLIQMLIQGMQFGQTIDELARGQWWIHPALPEVVEQALLALDQD